MSLGAVVAVPGRHYQVRQYHSCDKTKAMEAKQKTTAKDAQKAIVNQLNQWGYTSYSVGIGGGYITVLVDRKLSDMQIDRLAELADRHRLSIG